MFLFRADKPLQDYKEGLRDVSEPAEVRVPDDEYILCRQCGHPVTHRRFEAAVNGSHQHTFANPHGIVFEIGCFMAAEGAVYAGRPTAEWSWFAGYQWQLAGCGNCRKHLGWLFTGIDPSIPSFYGLVLDDLQESGS